MREGARLFSSFSFWLDKGMLRCDDNFWSNFLHSIVLVMKTFHLHCNLTGTYSKNRGRLQSVGRHGSSCHGYYNIHGLAAFFQLCRARLTRLHSPSTTMGSRGRPKNRKQTRWEAKEASKTFYGYPWAGMSSKSYTVHLFSWNVLDMKALRLVHRQLTPLNYAVIVRSVVGFKPKKFDLVHQTVFLVRGVVWAQD